jgi:hypothetical protein
MKILRIIFVLAGFFLLLALQTGCKGKNNIEEGLPWVPDNLNEATALINDKCPEWVDSESRLDSVLLLAEGLTFYYSLPNKVKSTIDSKAFKAFLLPEIIDNIQANYRLQMHRDSSITMVFNYLDRNGELITEFSVIPEIYK